MDWVKDWVEGWMEDWANSDVLAWPSKESEKIDVAAQHVVDAQHAPAEAAGEAGEAGEAGQVG